MPAFSFLWHDYETFGRDPRLHWPSQFAAIRTNEHLETIEEPTLLYCQPPFDAQFEQAALEITGITPELAREQGLNEIAFAKAVHQAFIKPLTCGVGYNTIRFDDEFSRHLFYRNFYDPFEREWANGNSRWDLIDVVRMTHALRPEGIHWPKREDGYTSFKLEHLSQANGIAHESAHDALSDVEATIGLAKLIKQAQPKLYDFAFKLRRKPFVKELLFPLYHQAIIHISGQFRAKQAHCSVVLPLIQHPQNPNGIICIDLHQDCQSALSQNLADIKRRVFTKNADLPEGVERFNLKTIHINKSPMIAPLSVLKAERASELGIDLDFCQQQLEHLKQHPEFALTAQQVFAEEFETPDDVHHQLYNGFFSDRDKLLMREVRQTPIEDLAEKHFDFDDPRLPKLLAHYLERNWFKAGVALESASL